MRGAAARLREEAQWQKELVWYGAALPNMKKIPALNDFLGRKKEKQSPDQMMAIARQWHQVVKQQERQDR